MRGCITKKGSSYYVVLDIGRSSTGRRKQKWFGGYKTKKEAEKHLVKYINEIENNTFVNSDNMTFKTFLEYWLDNYVDVNLSETTKYSYRHHLELHVIPTLGSIQLSKLQPIQLQKLYGDKLKHGRLDGKGGLSAKSVCNIHRVVRKALSYALKMQLVSRNIADFVEAPRRKAFNASVINDIDIPMYINAFKDSEMYVAVILALSVGLRRGEALGLRWKDIDFTNKTITINQAILHANRGIIFGSPKTKKSHRSIVLSDSILDLLKKQKAIQTKYKSKLEEAYNDYDLVCCHADGKPINPSTFSRMFAKILKRNNLQHVRFHDLRHTNATLMLKSNIPAKIASERLGHSTIGITMDLYSHVLNEMQQEAAEKLDNIIFK
jgi:integrase